MDTELQGLFLAPFPATCEPCLASELLSSSSAMERKPTGRTGPCSPGPFPSSSELCNGYILPPSPVFRRRIDPEYPVCLYRAVALYGSAVRGPFMQFRNLPHHGCIWAICFVFLFHFIFLVLFSLV